jgi:hypothetical protein
MSAGIAKGFSLMTMSNQIDAAIERQCVYVGKINAALARADIRDVNAVALLRKESIEAKSVLADLMRKRQQETPRDAETGPQRGGSIFIGGGK